jgi:hypothetical protein
MAFDDPIGFASQALSGLIPKLEVRPEDAWSEPDSMGFTARLGRKKLLVEVKELTQLRVQALVGQLAAGAVQADHRAAAKGPLPVVGVVAPTAGAKSLAVAERFMGRYLPKTGWAVLSRSGRRRVCIPTLDVDAEQRGALPSPAPAPKPNRRMFSDLNQWLLKLLLLPGLKKPLWTGPQGPYCTAADLQQTSRVSLDKVYKFLRLMEGADFLRHTNSGLKLVRVPDLIELWFAQEKLRPVPRLPVRSLFLTPPDPKKLTAKIDGETLGVLGGFSACKKLGVLHTAVASVDVHVIGPVDDYLERFDLERCDERDAQFHLLQSRSPQSVVRASGAKGSTQVVDVFQAALDLVALPARGLEQAEHIVELVLESRND